MPVYLQHEEAQRPTHDEQRDVSSADEVRFDYDLHTGARHRPDIQTSYGDAIIGPGVEERNDLVHSGKTNVVARSGNQHWDEDDDDGFTGVGAPAPEDRRDPNAHTIGGVMVGLGLIGLVYFLLKGRKD